MAVPKEEMTDIVDICHLVLILSGSRCKWWRFCGFFERKNTSSEQCAQNGIIIADSNHDDLSSLASVSSPLKAWLSLKKAGLLIKPLSIIMILVKNASGTSRWTKPSTGESTWLEYWEKRTGKKATQCGATDCHSKYNLVGAHVKKVYGGDELYITPLCTSCNQRSGNFYVDTELVRVPNGQ